MAMQFKSILFKETTLDNTSDAWYAGYVPETWTPDENSHQGSAIAVFVTDNVISAMRHDLVKARPQFADTHMTFFWYCGERYYVNDPNSDIFDIVPLEAWEQLVNDYELEFDPTLTGMPRVTIVTTLQKPTQVYLHTGVFTVSS